MRTRFFDDLLTAATWAEQVVLLGAGMDTRAYRLNLPPDTVVFELDHPDIFTAKNAVLKDVNPRCQRREVSADLGGRWEPALEDAGFDKARRTVWLAEGLFFYLIEDAVRGLLRSSARLCRVRALFGADVFGTGLLRLPSMQPLIEHRRGSNHPLPFCTDRPGELLAAGGWRTGTVVRLGQPQANLVDYLRSPLTGTGDPTRRWAPTSPSVSDTTRRWLFEAKAPPIVIKDGDPVLSPSHHPRQRRQTKPRRVGDRKTPSRTGGCATWATGDDVFCRWLRTRGRP